MGYRKYTRKEFDAIGKQHNIMILVGNGFDLEIMSNFGKNAKTSYENFYHFLEYQNCREDNMIFAKMREEKAKNNHLWCDFEQALIALLNEQVDASDLKEDLFEIQEYFSKFLNDIISPSFLAEIGKCSEDKLWAQESLSRFLGDLSEEDYKTIRFPANTKYYDMLNFVVFNFNYTALLDDYLYLDRKQFNPHPYKVADRNFAFIPNPNDYDSNVHDIKRKQWLSYIMMDIIHPHGVQNIPRSILFGFNDTKQLQGDYSIESVEHFIKPYWGQNDVKYKHYFAETELYIIFGMSIGKTDKWWWKNIVDSLQKEKSELIIYMYESEDKKIAVSDVKERFLTEAGVDLNKDSRKRVLDRIYVVMYGKDKERIFLCSTK